MISTIRVTLIPLYVYQGLLMFTKIHGFLDLPSLPSTIYPSDPLAKR